MQYKPAQKWPSPLNPVLQEHVKLPSVLAQTAFESQLSVLSEHSSISEKNVLKKISRKISVIKNIYSKSRIACVHTVPKAT